MTLSSIQRFYEQVTIAEEGEGYTVLLDNRQMKSPAKQTLCVPNEKMAQAIADEWQSQDDKIMLSKMPLTRMSFGAMDLSDEEEATLRRDLEEYSATDMLCYQESDEDELIKRQQASWQPWLNWAKSELGLSFVLATGIMPVEQPPKTLELIKQRIDVLSPWQLVPMRILVGGTGSYILSEAVRLGALPAAEAVAAAFLDADYQAERWGVDDDVVALQKLTAKDIHDAALFIALQS